MRFFLTIRQKSGKFGILGGNFPDLGSKKNYPTRIKKVWPRSITNFYQPKKVGSATNQANLGFGNVSKNWDIYVKLKPLFFLLRALTNIFCSTTWHFSLPCSSLIEPTLLKLVVLSLTLLRFQKLFSSTKPLKK